MKENTSSALANAPGQRAILHANAASGPRTSRATPPPANISSSVVTTSAISTTVEPTSIILRRTKLRPRGDSNTTLSARRAASR